MTGELKWNLFTAIAVTDNITRTDLFPLPLPAPHPQHIHTANHFIGGGGGEEGFSMVNLRFLLLTVRTSIITILSTGLISANILLLPALRLIYISVSHTSLSHTQTQPCTHTCALSLSHTHTFSLSHTLSLTLSLSLSHTHTHTQTD